MSLMASAISASFSRVNRSGPPKIACIVEGSLFSHKSSKSCSARWYLPMCKDVVKIAMAIGLLFLHAPKAVLCPVGVEVDSLLTNSLFVVAYLSVGGVFHMCGVATLELSDRIPKFCGTCFYRAKKVGYVCLPC